MLQSPENNKKSHIDINHTYIPEHNLTDDDRKFINLNEEFFLSASARSGAFYSLAEGICDLRLKHLDETIDKKKQFNLKTHLGSWNANEILDVFLKHKETISVNKDFQEFMNLVRENNEIKKYRTNYPPYIDTYYYDILKCDKKWEGDLEKSREKNRDTGKKYVVIMLSLLKEYKFKSTTPYVGIRQIMYLCNTTRDFLKIMKALFDIRMGQSSSKGLSYFFSFEAPFTYKEIEMQTQAALNVADDKYNNIEQKYSENATERMRTFIDTCGQILYDLQAKKELSSLTSEEKGIFTVSFENNEDANFIYDFFKSADVDTHIQILTENTVDNVKTIDFELSRMFAPKYKFSFRKTRNKITINEGKLIDYCRAKPNNFTKEAKKLIESIESKYELKIDKKLNIQQTLF